MKVLIRAAAASPVISNLLMVGLVVAGLASLLSITVKNFPEINLGAVQITVAYPGATPQEVADAIIVPIEGKVRAIDGIKWITGQARNSVASVTASLERGADVRVVLDEFKSAVGEVTVLPAGSESPVITERQASD